MMPHTPYLPPCHITWQGITLTVTYTPCWFTMPGYCTAHLEVRAVAPVGNPLPFSVTGYRSHFLPPESVEALGGPAAYARAWLDEAAKAPEWHSRSDTRQQLTLF